MNGVYPDVFIAASVTLLAKIPQLKQFSFFWDHFQPIFLICNIFKVLENIVHMQFLDHLKLCLIDNLLFTPLENIESVEKGNWLSEVHRSGLPRSEESLRQS